MSNPRSLTGIQTNFVGDSGSGGAQGLVPPLGAGDAATGKYLDADGTWTTPPDIGEANVNTDWNVPDAEMPNNKYIRAIQTQCLRYKATYLKNVLRTYVYFKQKSIF